MPRSRNIADHAHRGTDAGLFGTPDGQREVAGFDGIGRGRAGYWRVRSLDLEDGKVSSGITPRQFGGCTAAIWQRNANLFFATDGVVRGNNHAVAPNHAAGCVTPAGVHGDDGPARSFSSGR